MVNSTRAVIGFIIIAVIVFVIVWNVNNLYQAGLRVEEAKKEAAEAQKEVDSSMAELDRLTDELNRNFNFVLPSAFASTDAEESGGEEENSNSDDESTESDGTEDMYKQMRVT